MSNKFLNQFVKAAKTATESVSKKTGEFVEATKVNVAIADIENEVDDLYTEIGKLVFDAFSENAQPSEAINEKCAQIREKLDVLDELKSKVASIKDLTICPKCESENQKGSQYCSNCGEKLR